MIDINAWKTEKLWGAAAIAAFAGVSSDTVARWVHIPGCPITKVGGRLFVIKSALMEWMTAKPAVSA